MHTNSTQITTLCYVICAQHNYWGKPATCKSVAAASGATSPHSTVALTLHRATHQWQLYCGYASYDHRSGYLICARIVSLRKYEFCTCRVLNHGMYGSQITTSRSMDGVCVEPRYVHRPYIYEDQVNSIPMADPKYADLPGIVRYLDKYCTIFVMCVVV